MRSGRSRPNAERQSRPNNGDDGKVMRQAIATTAALVILCLAGHARAAPADCAAEAAVLASLVLSEILALGLFGGSDDEPDEFAR